MALLALPVMLPVVMLWLMLPLMLMLILLVAAAAVELLAEGVALPLGQTGAVLTLTFESLQNVTAKLVVAIVDASAGEKGKCVGARRTGNVRRRARSKHAAGHFVNR